MRLLLLGYGGHGRVCKEIAEGMRDTDGNLCYDKIDALDDMVTDVVGTLEKFNDIYQDYDEVFITIGNTKLRKKLSEQAAKAGCKFATLIHQSAYIAPSSTIEAGCVVMQGAIVQSCCKIYTGSIISSNALVDHDVVVSAYCHVNGGAVVSAGSYVPEGTRVDYNQVWRMDEE